MSQDMTDDRPDRFSSRPETFSSRIELAPGVARAGKGPNHVKIARLDRCDKRQAGAAHLAHDAADRVAEPDLVVNRLDLRHRTAHSDRAPAPDRVPEGKPARTA